MNLGAGQSGSGNDHVFQLEGLTAGTTYHYQVTLGAAAPFPETVFRTLPEPGSEVRVGVFGDSGKLTPAQFDIAAVLDDLSPDLLLHTGDIVYPFGVPESYQISFFDIYEELLARSCFYPALGNHDDENPRAYETWLNTFHLPANNPFQDERCDSFDAGDGHFAVMNVTTSDGVSNEEAAWLEDDLAASSRIWKVVAFHRPPYANTVRGGDAGVLREVVPVLERQSVDLVLSGHEHIYERFYPVRGGAIRSAFQDPDYGRRREPSTWSPEGAAPISPRTHTTNRTPAT